ncbi:MAG: WG repeat-containing protein, partial [Ruminiclostridium sp.]
MDFEKEPASVAEEKSTETDKAVEIPASNNKDAGKQADKLEMESSSISNLNGTAIVNESKSKKGKLGLVFGIAGALVVAATVVICFLIFSNSAKNINSEADNLFHCGLLGVCNAERKWGFIDATGKYIINPQFDYTYGFNDSGLAAVEIGDKYGYIDTSGKIVINP